MVWIRGGSEWNPGIIHYFFVFNISFLLNYRVEYYDYKIIIK